MMNKLIIDSNVFVSALSDEEISAQDSLAFFERLGETTDGYFLFLPRIVMVEAMNTLYRKCRKLEAVETLKGFVSTQSFRLVELDESVQTTTEVLLKVLQLKSLDLVIAASAYQTGATLISWDKRLVQEAMKVVPAMTPREFLKKSK